MRLTKIRHLDDEILVDELIAEGAMATIYRARLRRDETETSIVIKVPKMSIHDDADSVISFQVEALILPYLDGRSAPRFIASAPVTGLAFIAMEEIEGKTLDEWVSENTSTSAPQLKGVTSSVAPCKRSLHGLDFQTIHRLGINFARALSDLQSANVVHHDLKPSNIMIGKDGQLTLIDFGLSHHPLVPDLLAEEGRQPVGSSITLSPEQLYGVRGDARSDQFAWGVIMYWLTTGEYPFGEEDRPRALKRRLWFLPDPPRAFRQDVPEWFQEIMYRCLSVRPTDRYPSASQLLFELTNPSSVTLTRRGKSEACSGLLRQLMRKLHFGSLHPSTLRADSTRQARVPIVLVALNPSQLQENELNQSIRRFVESSLAAIPGARLMCITVINPKELSGTYDDRSHANTQRRYLAMLQAWSKPIVVTGSTPSFHVIEHKHPHEAIVRCAESNYVDVIVMGSRNPGGNLSAWLDSVSVRVAMQTHCAVLMARPPRNRIH
jgi:serine/threonine protein kinase